jgi:hypothetical protein
MYAAQYPWVMKQHLILMAILGLSVSGCGIFPKAEDPSPAPSALPATAAPPVRPTTLQDLGSGQSVASLNKTTEAQSQAALTAPPSSGERELGKVVVALGPPAEAGLWLKSTLVKAPAKGRLVTADGTSIAVDLLPGDGSALLSLAAFQALKLKLTELPEVTVYGL